MGLRRAVIPAWNPDLRHAKSYVATNKVSGASQFEILKREGLKPSSKLLEIGCGCLNAGEYFIEYLDRGNYVGVDPNEWLREAAMKLRNTRRLIADKKSTFLSNDKFDASSLGINFDYIFSHSVLSHAAHWQLDQYLENSKGVLAPNGVMLASIRLAEGNSYGSGGSPNKSDSMDKEWVYPGVSWFRLSTIAEAAAKQGLKAVHKPEYTEYHIKHRPGEFHDWVVFTRYSQQAEERCC